jgi:hypothetical protein
LISQAKVICQDRKDFNNEIKNIRHDLMLNEYPKEFVHSIIKPSRSNRPSLDIIFWGTVIIPYVKGKGKGKKVKISLLQAVEAHRVARGQGSHIT